MIMVYIFTYFSFLECFPLKFNPFLNYSLIYLKDLFLCILYVTLEFLNHLSLKNILTVDNIWNKLFIFKFNKLIKSVIINNELHL